MLKQAITQAHEANVLQNVDEYLKIAELSNTIHELLDEMSSLDKVDKRKLAIAKTNFETAELWLMNSLNNF